MPSLRVIHSPNIARAARLLVGLCLALPAAALAQPTLLERSAAGSATAATRARAAERARTRRHSVRAVASGTRWTTPRGSDALASDIGTMLGSRTRSGEWGVLIVSLTRGDTLFALDPDASLQPASNMKLFTTALALDEFGPAYQLSTDVLRTGSLGSDGVLQGDLFLRGDGDPSFSRRFFEGGPGAAMDSLAQLVAGAGVRHVRGSLVADATAFDTALVPDGWEHRYLSSGYAARVSALSLNENLVWVVAQPGASSHQAPSISLEPATDIPVINDARTVDGSSGARLIMFTTDDGAIEVRGWIGSRSGQRQYELVVEDPAAFTAGAFRRALAARGITVDGPTRRGATPEGAARVASLPSPPLVRMVDVMNGESINHYAELLFRDAARTTSRSRVGSVTTGRELLHHFMTDKVGAAPGAVQVFDGSGLSTLDRVTPRSVVQLLAYADRASWRDAFHASLPVAGRSELLRDRMRFTPAQGNLHAKTGTTNHVISLGGYVTALDGELLAFAFIYNGHDRWNAKSTIDQMGATLAAFARR